ncbi:MAG: carboxyl transferase domain-containing protein, partial [Bacteroidales bacterium]
AWPSAEIAVMGPKGAIEVLYNKKLAAIEDKTIREDLFHKYEDEYKAKFANPYDAAKHGFIDDIIVPRNTRFRVIRAFQALSTKKDTNPPKKHSNLPL